MEKTIIKRDENGNCESVSMELWIDEFVIKHPSLHLDLGAYMEVLDCSSLVEGCKEEDDMKLIIEVKKVKA